jgi:murein DD-endopeptidase MepM/ murein hydrolase activator NlpD
MGRQRGSVATRRARTNAYAVAAARARKARRAIVAPAAAATRTIVAPAAVAVASFAFVAAAGAQTTGGVSPTAPRPAPKLGAPPPGVVVPAAPRVRSWHCVEDCAGPTTARIGSILRVRGRSLARTYEVVFLGTEAAEDDITAAPLVKRRNRVDVRVPLGAAHGPLLLADRDGQQSAPSGHLTVDPAADTAHSGPAVEVQAQARRAYFDAVRPAKASYVVHGDSPANVLVELVRERDSAVVASWQATGVQPEVPQAVEWDGTAGGRVQREGRYSFRVSAVDASGVHAVSAQAPQTPAEPDPSAFTFLGHEFPIRGPHGYGEFQARFGGGRGHQGHDVFAACGTPLVAARGGTVEFEQYHSRAGHYIVIDGEQTGVDYAYMHLREASLVDEGDRVRTGQLIGYVGDSGSASGCHLHLEMWRAPGWYSGGEPFDPLPSLLAWDKRS